MTTKTTTKQKRKRATKFPGGAVDINTTLPMAMHDWVTAQTVLRHCKRADILREALTLYMDQYEGQTVAPVVGDSCDDRSEEPEPTEPSTRKIRKF